MPITITVNEKFHPQLTVEPEECLIIGFNPWPIRTDRPVVSNQFYKNVYKYCQKADPEV